MNTIFLISHIIGFVTLLILGLAVIIRNSKSATNILFVVFVLEFLIYLVVNYLSLIPNQSLDMALTWIRWVMAITSFTGPTVLLLAYTFPRPVLTVPLGWVAVLGLLGLASAASALSPYLFTEVVGYTANNVPLPSPGPLIAIYAISVPMLWLASFIVLIRKYRGSSGLEKSQLAYFLSGIIINLSYLLLLGIVAVNIFKTSAFIPFMPLSFVALAIFIAYAILRHRFLDIQPSIARAVSYIFFIVIIAAIYSVFFVFGPTFLFDISLDLPIIIGSISLTVIAALIFQPLYKRITKWTGKLFFQSLYDSEELLSKLTHIMSSTIDLNVMSRQILATLDEEVKITKAAILFLDNHRIISIKGSGYDVDLLKSPLEKIIHREIISSYHAILFQDLRDEAVKEIFRKYEIEAIFPITVGQEDIAILITGAKASGSMYSLQDLKLLDVFASEAGLAIKNAVLYENLKIVSEAKSKFISVVSHQLRTPLSGIRWSLEMLNQEAMDPKESKTFLDNSYQSVIFLSEQLDDILTALDIYDKRVFIKKDPCNLFQLFKDNSEEFSTLIKSKKLIIKYNIDDVVSLVPADHGKLKKIVNTLMKNAIVYSPNGGRISITARKETFNDRNRAVISISDEGIGITESEREHIFEEFFRSDKARTALPNGLGLGIFIAQAFIKAHDGDLWFYSEGRNKGADFHFSLPLD